jgi:hypothetical protein
VDDCIIVHSSKEELMALIPRLSSFLQENLCLNLHPKKIYLQHYQKGVSFTGIFIKPYRQYVGKRIRSKMNKAMINDYRSVYDPDDQTASGNLSHWIGSINSYLGVCKHYNTYRLRKSLTGRFADDPVISFNSNLCVAKYKYK